ncbi:3'-5' exonuclease [uncultured Muribaculum sp.]|uniref:3'-5' exonuclease n=1 Tax=uncultured Muribaculum sp. TaxID=1918613 RepID=UPI0025E3DEEB|nr:3'-5' exonuclease [uncultured Muribaculum sp.]
MAKKDWMIKESELDDDQILVLMAVLEKSCVVAGCAGSGKSVLALLKAQRIQREKGDDYKIIVFTKALSRYMEAGREQLGLNEEFYYYRDWKERFNCEGADYFIVDEIQDFSREEIEEFIDATGKNFFFFGDTAQSIYDGWRKETMPLEEIPAMLPRESRPKFFELYRNYRLPLGVARFVQHIGVDLDGFDERTYKSEETAVPVMLHYDDYLCQMRGISEIIRRQRLKDVGILLPTNDDVSRVVYLLGNLGMNCEQKFNDNNGSWADSLDFNTANPKIMTYHSAKGLQFESVFLPFIAELSEDKEVRLSQRKALYVAMTRTCRNLYIMYSGDLPSHLSPDVVPVDLYKTTSIENIEDI